MRTFQPLALWPGSQGVVLCGHTQVPLCTLLSFLLAVSLPPWAHIYLAQIFPANPSVLSQLYIKTHSQRRDLTLAIPSLSISAQPHQIRGAVYLIYLCFRNHDSGESHLLKSLSYCTPAWLSFAPSAELWRGHIVRNFLVTLWIQSIGSRQNQTLL